MPLNLEVIKTKLVNPRPFEIACIIDEDAPALIAEVERLRKLISEKNEALEFYGDIENYQLNKIGHGFLSPIVMADGGNKARKAVEGKKPARTPEENALIDKVIANLQALDGEK